jgi:hypothetical protein
MPRTDNLYALPTDLPMPPDDGACDHLTGMPLPAVSLTSTAGRVVDLANLGGRTVVYCYPRTGRPDQEPPPGWNAIPGAGGCTPQSCGFRDHYQDLQRLGARVFGLSTQDTAYQPELLSPRGLRPDWAGLGLLAGWLHRSATAVGHTSSMRYVSKKR